MSRFFYYISSAWVLMYISIRCLERGYGNLGFVSNYLTDLISLPIVFSVLLFLLFQLKKEKGSRRLPLFFIFIYLLAWSYYFEWYLPAISQRYTGDKLDVLMYTLGAIVFNLLQPLMLKKTVVNFVRKQSHLC